MWQLAADSLSHFPEVIVTTLNVDGYPVSVRQRSPIYDARTGEMRVFTPPSVRPMLGPANLLAHYHDEKLWNMRMMHIKGHLERRDDHFVFISTAFAPPPHGELKFRWQMVKAMRRSSHKYLAARGLRRPKVNWAAIKDLQRQAQRHRTRTTELAK